MDIDVDPSKLTQYDENKINANLRNKPFETQVEFLAHELQAENRTLTRMLRVKDSKRDVEDTVFKVAVGCRSVTTPFTVFCFYFYLGIVLLVVLRSFLADLAPRSRPRCTLRPRRTASGCPTSSGCTARTSRTLPTTTAQRVWAACRSRSPRPQVRNLVPVFFVVRSCEMATVLFAARFCLALVVFALSNDYPSCSSSLDNKTHLVRPL